MLSSQTPIPIITNTSPSFATSTCPQKTIFTIRIASTCKNRMLTRPSMAVSIRMFKVFRYNITLRKIRFPRKPRPSPPPRPWKQCRGIVFSLNMSILTFRIFSFIPLRTTWTSFLTSVRKPCFISFYIFPCFCMTSTSPPLSPWITIMPLGILPSDAI